MAFAAGTNPIPWGTALAELTPTPGTSYSL